MNNPAGQAAGHLRMLLAVHMARLRVALCDGERGASAVELAVITAFILAIAIGLLVVIRTFVHTEQSKINAP